ncbi:MAG: HAD-IIB family hydrolase [Erysipelotrichaceae bacterium]
MIKIAFFDIDNTIYCTKSNRLVEYSIKAIKELQNKGVLCFICTSRTRAEMQPLFYDVGFDGYIFCDGSQIIIDEIEVFHQVFSLQQMEELIKIFANKNYNPVYVSDDMYTFDDHIEEVALKYLNDNNLIYQIKKLTSNDKIEKIDFFYPINFTLPDGLVWYAYRNDYYNIRQKSVDKGSGVIFVCQYLNISLDDAICFGDSINDLSMFKIIKNNYCLNNGCEELKKQASHIIGDVDSDTIYQLCRNNKWI